MRLNVRDGWWGRLPMDLPGSAAPIGYAWMVQQRDLDVMPHHRWSFAAKIGGRSSFEFQGLTWESFPERYAPTDLPSQLEFAFKYDGINLEILRAWFEVLPVEEVEVLEFWIRSSPTSAYARRAWFLYELLTGRSLSLEDVTAGPYVPLLDPEHYFVTQERRSRRHRILDNLFGGRDFCVLVRRTPALVALAGRGLDRRVHDIFQRYDADTLARVVSYLYTKETRSTYQIEREKPTTDKLRHFVAVLRRTHDWPSLSHQDLVELQRLIVTDPRSRADGYREEQNYVGGPGPRDIAFVSPRPEELPLLMVGWMQLLGRLSEDPVDAVVAAAAVSFSFVYLHPFEDGNGRIHRFLLHYILARRRFTPPGVLVPISATMLARMKEYDVALEVFSEPLLARLRYQLDSEFRVEVLHDSSNYYRYPDLTRQTEALYGWVASTIEEDVPKEIMFMLAYQDARSRLVQLIELPDRKLEHFLARCLEQGGKLSNRRRHKDFESLSDEEVRRMEAVVQESMRRHGMETAT